MTTSNLDATDLKAVDFQGLIREDVMNQIWDISAIPLPFTDLVGTDTTGNDYASWTTDKLADPAIGGWIVDGADSDQNDSATGARIGNHCGILTREVQVSTRARESDTIGTSDELAYQVMMRQRELRRNVEANALGIQGSQESDAENDVPGIPAGLAAMVAKFASGSGGSGGVFSSGIWSPWTPGAAGVALTETMVRDAAQAAWESGGDPSHMMSVPSLIRAFSEYCFTSSSRIATLTAETNQNGPATAMGSVNVFLTDFGVELRMIANRLQQTYLDGATDAAASLFILDPAYARLTYLHGYRTEELAKTGLSDKRLMAVDWTLKALEPLAHRVIPDINPALPVTQN
jgi:hypothetical protein